MWDFRIDKIHTIFSKITENLGFTIDVILLYWEFGLKFASRDWKYLDFERYGFVEVIDFVGICDEDGWCLPSKRKRIEVPGIMWMRWGRNEVKTLKSGGRKIRAKIKESPRAIERMERMKRLRKPLLSSWWGVTGLTKVKSESWRVCESLKTGNMRKRKEMI